MGRLLIILLVMVPLQAEARLLQVLPPNQMRDEAAMVVIATPIRVRHTTERAELPDIEEQSPEGVVSPVIASGIETTFQVVTILKGDAQLKTFVLHHFRCIEERAPDGSHLPPPINGPGTVSFDPAQHRSFLLFLKKTSDGRFEAASGQTDPDLSIIQLPHSVAFDLH